MSLQEYAVRFERSCRSILGRFLGASDRTDPHKNPGHTCHSYSNAFHRRVCPIWGSPRNLHYKGSGEWSGDCATGSRPNPATLSIWWRPPMRIEVFIAVCRKGRGVVFTPRSTASDFLSSAVLASLPLSDITSYNFDYHCYSCIRCLIYIYTHS